MYLIIFDIEYISPSQKAIVFISVHVRFQEVSSNMLKWLKLLEKKERTPI